MDLGDLQFSIVFQIAHLIFEGPVAHSKQPAFYPGMVYMSYGANQLNVPTRVGFMSSEDMPGGRGSPLVRIWRLEANP